MPYIRESEQALIQRRKEILECDLEAFEPDSREAIALVGELEQIDEQLKELNQKQQ